MDQLPIKFDTLFDLRQLEVSQQAIGFQTLSLSSKYISIRELPGNVLVIDIDNPRQLDKRAIRADSAIMGTHQKRIALKAGTTLQAFQLETNSKLGDSVMTEPVEFWKWISPSTLGIITTRSVYHWDLSSDSSEPKSLFPRLPHLNGCRIVDYKLNEEHSWACLVGNIQEGQRTIGQMQLHSFSKGVSQKIEGHAAAFLDSTTFCFVTRNTPEAKIYLNDLSTGTVKSVGPVLFPATAPFDFPVSLSASPNTPFLYLLTKEGYFHMISTSTTKEITVCKISSESLVGVSERWSSEEKEEDKDGVVCVNQLGQVIFVGVNKDTVVQYIATKLGEPGLALISAMEGNLRGAEELVLTYFRQLLNQGKVNDAAKFAAESPQGLLRSLETINLFKGMGSSGANSPLSQYLTAILEKGRLSEQETLELCVPLLRQGRKDAVEKWFLEGKIEAFESLADLIVKLDTKLAFSMYDKGGKKNKAITLLAMNNELDSLIQYAKSFTPNWLEIIQTLITVNPNSAVSLSISLLSDRSNRAIDPNEVVDLFIKSSLPREATHVLVEVLAPNNKEDAKLQTRLLEICFTYTPMVAVAILQKKMITHYDKQLVCKWLQQMGEYGIALLHAEDVNEIRSILRNYKMPDVEVLKNFLKEQPVQVILSCLDLLLEDERNTDMVATIAQNCYVPEKSDLKAQQVLTLFQNHTRSSIRATYLFLKPHINQLSKNKEMVYEFIKSAVLLPLPHQPDLQILKNVLQNFEYEPLQVRDLLFGKNQTSIPLLEVDLLLIISDRFNYHMELTEILVKNNMWKLLITILESSKNPGEILNKLFDMNCDDSLIVELLESSNVHKNGNLGSIISGIEKRNKLLNFTTWFEKLENGTTDEVLHTTRGKVLFLKSSDQLEQFLDKNPYYNSLTLGKFFETFSSPEYAFLAYRKKHLHAPIIDLTSRHNLWTLQARYILSEKDPNIWVEVFSPKNLSRANLINTLIHAMVPEIPTMEAIFDIARALMNAQLLGELFQFTEKVIFNRSESEIKNNRELQNLLMITAIRIGERKKLGELGKYLEFFDALEVGKMAIEAKYYEEAFEMYKKFGLNIQAFEVMVNHIKDINRATSFVENCSHEKDLKELYSKLGEVQLKKGLVVESMDSFVKAENPNFSDLVIRSCKKTSEYMDPLTYYLKMCRRKIQSEPVDSELMYTYAKTNRILDLQELLDSSHVANLLIVGEKCFKEGLYEAARMIFVNLGNYSRAALAMVKLNQFTTAIEAAKKANSVQTWKEIHRACIEAGEFRFDVLCGSNVLINPELVQETVVFYEKRGHFDQIIQLLESLMDQDRAQSAILTQLGGLYARHKPQKLLNYLKIYKTKIHHQTIIQACQANMLWKELLFLYELTNSPNQSLSLILTHPISLWNNEYILDLLSNPKIENDYYYQTLDFYLTYHPDMVPQYLDKFFQRLDPVRVVEKLRNRKITDNGKEINVGLLLGKKYLQSVQEKDIGMVNDLVNEGFIEEEDWEGLKDSVRRWKNFDRIGLAKKLEKSELLEFRVIAAELYADNKRWKHSIQLSKADKMWKNAINTAYQSKDQELILDLLHYFATNQNKECFSALLYTCYEFIPLDVVLEYGWRNEMINNIYPYLIQFSHEYANKVDYVYNWIKNFQSQRENEVKPVEPTEVPSFMRSGERKNADLGYITSSNTDSNIINSNSKILSSGSTLTSALPSNLPSNLPSTLPSILSSNPTTKLEPFSDSFPFLSKPAFPKPPSTSTSLSSLSMLSSPPPPYPVDSVPSSSMNTSLLSNFLFPNFPTPFNNPNKQ